MRARVLSDHLEHDGARVPAGTVLELTDAQAAPLLALGAIEPLPSDEARAEDAPTRRGRR